MTKQLTIDEMLECLIDLQHEAAPTLQAAIEAIGSTMAQLIAAKLNVVAGAATFEGTAFAGACAPFTPRFPDQPCPDPLSRYDSCEWDEDPKGPSS
ncbi:MAG: hypothetical protein WBO09_01705 [Methylocystis silviterrae]|uniref:hypothetical protein n=1 Tax=Methylocystis silviterrae TaxID=2743612 RepID=UPI003C78C286